MLDFLAAEDQTLIGNVTLNNSTIIPPCYIADGVMLSNSTVGPHVSVGAGTSITESTIENSIIQSNSTIENASLKGAMIGNHVHYNGQFTRVSIGDYSVLE
jgi:glucose-1-phosphate thymidylyltransferase